MHVSTRSPDLDYPKGYIYSRVGNPTRALLEDTLAQCEGGGEVRLLAQSWFEGGEGGGRCL